MDKFLKFTGVITCLVIVAFLCFNFYQHFSQIFNYVFWGLGIIAFLYILVRVFFGENWFITIGLKTYFGSDLISSFNKFYSEFPNKISKKTLSELSAHIINRLTRIGVIMLLITSLPIWLLFQQNKIIESQNDLIKIQTNRLENQNALFKEQNGLLKTQNDLYLDQNENVEIQTGLFIKQNELFDLQNKQLQTQLNLLLNQNNLLDTQNYRIKIQTNLLEADRRSSYVYLMSNILDRVQEELKDDYKSDSIRNLSPELIARIVSLSYALKPYRYLDDGIYKINEYKFRDDMKLIAKPTSPERGQLLLTLINSKLDTISYDKIFRDSDFTFSELKDVTLKNAYLDSLNFEFSDFQGTKFINSSLRFTALAKANLKHTNFIGSNLENTMFAFSDLGGSRFSKCNLLRASFAFGNMYSVMFSNSNIGEAFFSNIDNFEIGIDNCYVSTSYNLNGNYESNFFDVLQKSYVMGVDSLRKKYYVDISSPEVINSKLYYKIKPR